MSPQERQRRNALKAADAIRFARADAKKAIKNGDLSILDAIQLECCQTMRLYDLLRAQWHWGPTAAADRLSRLGIGFYRTCGELTDRQRGLL